MKQYTYHDVGDVITQLFIKQHEPHAGYWASSESRALHKVRNYLTQRVSTRDTALALDIGCGEGRLLPWLAEFAHTIVATDPDQARVAIARSQYSAIPSTNITFSTSDFTSLEASQYDLVLCSHIIQHIQSSSVVASLKRMFELTKSGGFLVISYCKHTKADSNQGPYFFDTIENKTFSSTAISEQQFNRFVQDGVTHGLPVHHIDPLWLREQAKTMGWEPRFSWSFHVIENDSQVTAQDEWVNQTENRALGYGRDIIEVWQKT